MLFASVSDLETQIIAFLASINRDAKDGFRAIFMFYDMNILLQSKRLTNVERRSYFNTDTKYDRSIFCGSHSGLVFGQSMVSCPKKYLPHW